MGKDMSHLDDLPPVKYPGLYVAGFLFTLDERNVLMIEKQKLRGKLNGVGGNVEPKEWPVDAMRREFREETGLDLDTWAEFCVLTGKDRDFNPWQVSFYKAVWPGDPYFPVVKRVNEAGEELVWKYVKDMSPTPCYPCISNIPWLLPMATSAAGMPWWPFHVKETSR